MSVSGYRDRATGDYPIPLSMVRARVTVLFGAAEPPEPWVLDEANVDPVIATAQPAYDPSAKLLNEGEPRKDEAGYFQTWVLTDIPPAPVPVEVTRRQAKIVLSRSGLLAQADQIIASMSGRAGEEARIDWTDAAVFRRDNPLILGIGVAVGLTSQQIDDLFRQASLIA